MNRCPIILGFGLSLALTACGGKISSDVPIDSGTMPTGDSGTADAGATADGGTDAGTADSGTGDAGTASDDLDGDGWSVAAGDCDDTDDTIYPDAPDDCYDGVDSNCDGSDDNDCDGDGYYPTDLKGDDCDDTDADVHPGASETRANGIDNDCDSIVDEDAYCNLFAPLSNESSSYRVYDTVFFDGTTYAESDSLTGFSETDNTVTLERILDDGAGGGMTISEDWGCDTDGAAQVTGYTVSSMG
ncbi:MAG: hypothetical protein GXP62_13420 [Oligoflexia bacterium]|nr:hypothetical protein [Oligoflexia bacterium]